MSNIHADITKGKALDEVLECIDRRKATEDIDKDCAVVTDVLPWDRASHLIQPIYPANDPLEVSHPRFLFEVYT